MHINVEHACELRLNVGLLHLELFAVGRQVVVVLLSVALQVGDAGAIVLQT